MFYFFIFYSNNGTLIKRYESDSERQLSNTTVTVIVIITDYERNTKENSMKIQINHNTTLVCDDSTRRRRRTAFPVRPDERTRFTITMSAFHGHTPVSPPPQSSIRRRPG